MLLMPIPDPSKMLLRRSSEEDAYAPSHEPLA
jgi:hypothetical protein